MTQKCGSSHLGQVTHLVPIFLMGKGERDTVSVSYQIYVKLSKNTKE